MGAVAAIAICVLSAAGLVAARAGPDVHIARSVRSLERRADASSPSTSTYLSDVFQMETPRCNSTCAVSLGDFDACSQLSNQASIAACACSAQTLGDLRACASCISTTTKSDSNSTAVVNAYNSFVELCLQEGLVSVTGTVEVGASTKSMSRTSITAASASTASASTATSALPSTITSGSLATYNPSRAPVSTATVPSLVASGSIASSARAAAASASESATSTNQKTSGAASSRTAVGQALVGVAAFAAGAAFLA
ncbi:hypothetical protein JCM3774_000026 [Rhodotorula dairenensis]